jgi:hypothetical protein
MKSATELYHVPLVKRSFILGDVEIPLEKGLLSTCENLKKNIAPSVLRLLGPRLDCKTRDTTKIQAVLLTYAQLEWYRAKGSTCPATVIETYNNAMKEASVSEPEQTAAPESAPTTEAPKKERAGTRPYCRSLIDAGELNEAVLLAAVNERFPDKPFKLGDVRGCLRNAGKLDWTARKGSKKAAPAAE